MMYRLERTRGIRIDRRGDRAIEVRSNLDHGSAGPPKCGHHAHGGHITRPVVAAFA